MSLLDSEPESIGMVTDEERAWLWRHDVEVPLVERLARVLAVFAPNHRNWHAVNDAIAALEQKDDVH